jgi:hypothetical protein
MATKAKATQNIAKKGIESAIAIDRLYNISAMLSCPIPCADMAFEPSQRKIPERNPAAMACLVQDIKPGGLQMMTMIAPEAIADMAISQMPPVLETHSPGFASLPARAGQFDATSKYIPAGRIRAPAAPEMNVLISIDVAFFIYDPPNFAP